jgi:hypothetical protein
MDIDENPNQLVKDQPIDMICMFDEVSFMDDVPKYDQYDDDYINVNSSKPSTKYCWEEAQLQIKYDSQPLHNNHDNNEENAANRNVSGKCFPLCFSSFQILRENHKQIIDSKDE